MSTAFNAFWFVAVVGVDVGEEVAVVVASSTLRFAAINKIDDPEFP